MLKTLFRKINSITGGGIDDSIRKAVEAQVNYERSRKNGEVVLELKRETKAVLCELTGATTREPLFYKKKPSELTDDELIKALNE